MRILQYPIFCCLILFFTSCSDADQAGNDESQVKEIKLISDQAEKTMLLSALYEIGSYIPLETGDEVFVGEISKLMVVGDTIWILDNIVEQVLGFSDQGKLITVINQKGEGP